MKRIAWLMALLMLWACGGAAESLTPDAVIERLTQGNARYVAGTFEADISPARRAQTAREGQLPCAVVLACSDSRVPVEAIFSMGVGDLFIVRTAGNVVGEYERGSIEYGAEHLGASVIVVMGHTGCGAVAAALEGHAEGNIRAITDEIALAIGEETDADTCVRLNMDNSARRILQSELIAHLVEAEQVKIALALYDIGTGEVAWLEDGEEGWNAYDDAA